MRVLSLRNAALALVAGLGLGGCAYGPYGGLGVGVGSGYGYNDPYYNNGYGYSPYGYGASYSPYGYGSSFGYGSGFGYGYGSPYYGWNDGFYYPGTGYYVYDQYRRPHRWTDAQRRYWEQRRQARRSDAGTTQTQVVQNWSGFSTRNADRTIRQQSVVTRPAITRQQISTDRSRVRAEARQERRSARSEVREERRELRVKTHGKRHDDESERGALAAWRAPPLSPGAAG
jgi:hypothetical protein